MSIADNAARTRAMVRAQSIVTGKTRRRGKLPRQAEPKMIAKEYGQALARIVSREMFRDAFAALLAELPELLASARRERGDRNEPERDAIEACCLDDADRLLHWRARLDADEGKRARALIAQAKEKMRTSVSTRLIEDVAGKFAERTSTFQRVQLNRQVKSAFGVDVFYGDRSLRNRMTNFATENVSLIKDITENVAGKVEKAVTRAITGATPHGDLARTLEEDFGYGEKRAKLIARDQVGKLYGQINASRQKDLGVRRFRWKTTGDERVRGDPSGKYPDADSSHYDWDGEIFSYDDPPQDEDGNPVLPGEPILCRCWAEPILEDVLNDDEGES